MKGCNVQEGQGKKFFRFPKDPERRSIWVLQTGRKFWQPTASSCICEVNIFIVSRVCIAFIDNALILSQF